MISPRHLWSALLSVALWAEVSAQSQTPQVTVNRFYAVNQVVADQGQYVSAMEIADAGLASISSVSASLNLSSADSTRPMVLGQFLATLTHGTASDIGGATSAYLFNRPSSTASSLNATYTFADNFDGSWGSNLWSLLLADKQKGAGAASFNNWGLSITGTAANGATVGLGNNGQVSLSSGTSAVGSTFAVGSGQTAALNVSSGSVLDFAAGGGGLSGAGTFNAMGGGKVVLGGNNTGFTGNVVLGNSGNLEMASSGALGAGSLNLGAGSTLKLRDGVSFSRSMSVAAGTTARLETAANTTAMVAASAFNGVSGTLEKRGAGTAVISGTTTGFSGTLAVKEGGVNLDAANLGASSKVRLAKDSFNRATDTRATLSGTGTVGDLEVGLGGAVGPGNSPGQLNVSGNAIFGEGGSFIWEINNFMGSSGVNWDFVSVDGTLNVTATKDNPFFINVVSLLASNGAGDAENFFPTYDYSFAIATATGGVGGFSTDAVKVDTSAFTNAVTFLEWANQPTFTPGYFTVGLSGDGNSIVVTYAAAIPEPNSATLLLLGLGVAWFHRRRRG